MLNFNKPLLIKVITSVVILSLINCEKENKNEKINTFDITYDICNGNPIEGSHYYDERNTTYKILLIENGEKHS